MIKHRNIQPKPRTFQGKKYQWEERNNYNADVEPGKSIRIFGTYNDHISKPEFDKTFEIGDQAVWGAYNLTYTGEIVSIGKSTVTITRFGIGERKKRLDLRSFCFWNWDYDAEKIAKHNLNESYYI